MKVLLLILCFCLNFAATRAQTPSVEHFRSIRAGARSERPQLQFTTSIARQRYSVESGTSFIFLTLNLTYTNRGARPILLDKKSSLIYRVMVSKSLDAASAKKYEYDASFSYFDLRKAGLRIENAPEESAFVTLKSGESFSLEKEVGVRLYDGTEDSRDFLHSGDHFLQLRVTTWYYLVPPNAYRTQWRNKGFLWSQDVTSLPMPFTVNEEGLLHTQSP